MAALLAVTWSIGFVQGQERQPKKKQPIAVSAEAGGFIRIPGGTKHWSGGDAKEGALMYEESSSKFDLVPAK